MRHLVVTATALLLCAPSLSAQSAAADIARGDSARSAREAAAALDFYRAALASDSNSYEATWKASRELVDLAEFEPDRARQKQLYAEAEQLARRAVALDSVDAEGHFTLARALGRVALTLGKRDRVKYAREVRSEALEALRYAPTHAGALHVMGMWNAEVMRLSGFSRWAARTFLGGQVFSQASWANARRYMEAAVAADPERITHRLDLGAVYADMGERALAREQLERVLSMPVRDYNDPQYQKAAAALLSRL